jgi:hypothetical protein
MVSHMIYFEIGRSKKLLAECAVEALILLSTLITYCPKKKRHINHLNFRCATRFNWLFIVKLGKNFDSILFFFFYRCYLGYGPKYCCCNSDPVEVYTFNGKL